MTTQGTHRAALLSAGERPRRLGRDAVRWAALTIVCVVSLGTPDPGSAQDTGIDDDLYVSQDLLAAPVDLEKAKRREAKRTGHWSVLAVGSTAAGFDSNIHRSPNRRQPSAFGAFGVALDALRYMGDAHRLKLSVEATGRTYTESSRTDAYIQQLKIFYGFRPRGRLSFTTGAKVKHRNDAATTIEGEDLLRGFEYFSYHLSSGLWIRLSDRQTLRLASSVRRRDYLETSGLPSLDNWKVSPRLAYYVDVTKAVRADAFYVFAAQYYDDEPSSDVFGTELATNRPERHFFHTVGFELDWDATRDLPVALSYSYGVKQDRFQDFESYSGHDVDLSVDWLPASRWFVHATASFQDRDYDHRPASGGKLLRYDRWTAAAGASYRTSEHTAVFLDYDVGVRDSNRGTDFTTFRDYVRHRTMLGLRVSY